MIIELYWAKATGIEVYRVLHRAEQCTPVPCSSVPRACVARGRLGATASGAERVRIRVRIEQLSGVAAGPWNAKRCAETPTRKCSGGSETGLENLEIVDDVRLSFSPAVVSSRGLRSLTVHTASRLVGHAALRRTRRSAAVRGAEFSLLTPHALCEP